MYHLMKIQSHVSHDDNKPTLNNRKCHYNMKDYITNNIQNYHNVLNWIKSCIVKLTSLFIHNFYLCNLKFLYIL